MSEFETENTTQVEETEANSWPATRMFIELGTAFAVLVLFGLLIYRLAKGDGTGAVGWTLVAFMFVLLIGQAVVLFWDRLVNKDDDATEPAFEEGDWDDGEDWDAGPTLAPAPTMQDPGVGFMTVGCPECATAFAITEEDAAKGHFHCVHCGVKGFIDNEDLDLESIQAVTCTACSHEFDALNDQAQCPGCGHIGA